MGLALWYFVETSDGSMRRIASKKAQAFIDGRTSIAASLAGEIRMAQIGLRVDRRCVVEYWAAWWTRYLVTPEGLVDPEHHDDAMRLVAEMLASPLSGPDVVPLGPRIAKRDYNSRHTWQPTASQLQAVANTVNKAAPEPPVVIVAADGLRAVR